MIDTLWIAASGVDYARSVGHLYNADEFVLDYLIDRHPCDDLPWVADIQVVGAGWRHTEQFDGTLRAGDLALGGDESVGDDVECRTGPQVHNGTACGS